MTREARLQEVRGLLGRALCYRWAARLFAYPDEQLLSVLQNGLAEREMAEGCTQLPNPDVLHSALLALWAAWGSQEEDIPLGAEHNYLFARQVLAPPYESRYREMPGVSMTQDMSDIASFYAAFGFQVGQRAKELPDHVSLELEFVAVLCLKEAYALEQGWSGRARITRTARDKFLREHLGWWLDPFEERVQTHARLPFYPAVAAFVRALVGQEPTLSEQSLALSSSATV